MNVYFIVLGTALIAGGSLLLLARLRFMRDASMVSGTVVRIRRMHFDQSGDGGPSMHIEVEYANEHGERCLRVIDNSLLAWVYRPGQKVELAVSGDRVMVKSLIHLVTAPLTLVAMGVVTLSIPLLLK